MIQFKGVSKKFNTHLAVKNLDLEIRQNELFILLGESGSGKTTTLKMVNRLLDPDSGEIFLDGQNIRFINESALRKGIGYVMQSHGLFPHYTVLENISVVPTLLKWNKKAIKKRAIELLQIFGLDPERFSALYPQDLSGGQQQRVGMIRALMAGPALILMDEPLGALDPQTRRSIRQEFRTLKELTDKTILMVTHDVQEAFMMADRIGLMYNGEILQVGRPVDFLLTPASEEVRYFFKDQHFQLLTISTGIAELLPELSRLSSASDLQEKDDLNMRLKINSNTRVSELLEVFSQTALLQLVSESPDSVKPLYISQELLLTVFFSHIRAEKNKISRQ